MMFLCYILAAVFVLTIILPACFVLLIVRTATVERKGFDCPFLLCCLYVFFFVFSFCCC